MFICVDKCIKLYNNSGILMSYGPCEICGERKECYDIPSKYLELKNPPKETFVDSFGHKLFNVHNRANCNPPCTIHSHSDHKLADKPLLWRNDRGIFEHMCEHGIGHPCPDSLPTNDSGIHGCDRCCLKG